MWGNKVQIVHNEFNKLAARATQYRIGAMTVTRQLDLLVMPGWPIRPEPGDDITPEHTPQKPAAAR